MNRTVLTVFVSMVVCVSVWVMSMGAFFHSPSVESLNQGIADRRKRPSSPNTALLGTCCKPAATMNATRKKTNEAMKLRGRTLAERCDKLHGRQHFKPHRVFVEDRHKFLICIINKVGSTNIERSVQVLQGLNNQSDPADISVHEMQAQEHHMKRLYHMTIKDILDMLQHYKKFVFVREPLERLVSAYNDKFKSPLAAPFRKVWLPKILKRIYPNRSFQMEYKLTFAEFIQFIIHPATIKEGYDDHWATYSSVCQPCSIRYDFVGKYETFNEDMNSLLEEIGATDIRFPQSSSKSASYLEEYYSGIPTAHLKQLKNIYANDSFLFDYKFPAMLEKLVD